MTDRTAPPPSPLQGAAGQGSAFLSGLRAGLFSVFSLVIAATYLGIGALSHDLGLSLSWSVVATVVIWGAPTHVIFITALAGGAGLVEVAAAVGVSGVRLLPMVVAVLPMLRARGVRNRHLLLPAHFTAISMWVEGSRTLPAWPPERRVAFYNGLGTGMCVPAVVCTVVGYALAGRLPVALAAALMFVTPLAFLMSLSRNGRALVDHLALVFGMLIAPVVVAAGIGLDLMWTGVIGGTAAYAIHRWRKGRT